MAVRSRLYMCILYFIQAGRTLRIGVPNEPSKHQYACRACVAAVFIFFDRKPNNRASFISGELYYKAELHNVHITKMKVLLFLTCQASAVFHHGDHSHYKAYAMYKRVRKYHLQLH